MSTPFRIVGVNFDHMHMGDLLRFAAGDPGVEIVGVSDPNPERVYPVLEQAGLSRDLFVANEQDLLRESAPDMVVLCPATNDHADWVERVAPHGPHVFIEKPFAASLADADRMIAAVGATGRQLVINWPLRWCASHVKAKHLIDQDAIGELLQVHFYDGNRGPLRHLAGKEVVPKSIANAQKAESWWYRRDSGGGSLLDYLGYGATLGTWFMDGRPPVEVMAMTDRPEGLEVDEHAITVLRYDIPGSGLSKLETRWGTFADPWITQPQPKCGFVLVGRNGTISSYDYDPYVSLQTDPMSPPERVPAEALASPDDNPISYVASRLREGRPIEGPLSPEISRTGQRIVDAAIRSVAERCPVELPGDDAPTTAPRPR